MTYFEGGKLVEPELLFDRVDTSARSDIPYRGLFRHGPFDKTHNEIRIVLLCPKKQQSRMKQLIEALSNGASRFDGGMNRFFRSNIVLVEEYLLETESISEYQYFANHIIASKHPDDIDLVLCYVPFSNRFITNTPYYFLKTIFAQYGISSQMVTYRTFNNLSWSYLNLAVAIFSKTGGIPWVLADGCNNTDIIIGLSLSNVISEKSRAGDIPRYVGCANTFDRYGRWMFFEGTASIYRSDFESRKKQLDELISKCVIKYEAENGRKPKRFVFHYSKKVGRFERKHIEEILDNLVGEVEIAFLSITSDHPFRIYDVGTSDGSLSRGSYAKIGKNGFLLSTTGHSSIAGRRLGTPKLLRIVKQYTNSDNFKNEDLLQNILGLTKLNWGSSMPLVREPITLTYSNKLAFINAILSIDEWADIVSYHANPILSKRPWFI